MLYKPKKIKIEPTDFQRIDSGILALIPKNQMVLLHQNLKKMKSMKFVPESNVWVEIINKSCSLPIKMPKGHVLGFSVAKPEHLKFQYETPKNIKKATKEKCQKTLSWKKKNKWKDSSVAVTLPMQVGTLLTKQQKLLLE